MADKDYYEYLNTIDTLNEQIMAMLDLMRSAEANTDMKSITTVADMCMNMQIDLMKQVNNLEHWCRGKNE